MKMYVIHGRDDCPFCLKALDVLTSFRGKLSYAARFYHDDEKPMLLFEQEKWEWKTVPVIVEISDEENGDYIERLVGGYTDLCQELGVEQDD